ncbi:hypothetical protein KCU76_g14, partial [Aureobasidium melanogenum]
LQRFFWRIQPALRTERVWIFEDCRIASGGLGPHLPREHKHVDRVPTDFSAYKDNGLRASCQQKVARFIPVESVPANRRSLHWAATSLGVRPACSMHPGKLPSPACASLTTPVTNRSTFDMLSSVSWVPYSFSESSSIRRKIQFGNSICHQLTWRNIATDSIYGQATALRQIVLPLRSTAAHFS